MNRAEHIADWEDRLQDAIDGALDDRERAELTAHLNQCELCRNHYATLSALHARLARELGSAPQLSVDFSARVLAQIDAQEDARRRMAQARAEEEFRRRVEAVKLNWRELWQRHSGSLIAALFVVIAVGATLIGSLESAGVRFNAIVNANAWLSNPLALPAALGLVSAAVSALTLWWLKARAR